VSGSKGGLLGGWVSRGRQDLGPAFLEV
jgi:hypothetical protein